MYIGGSFIAVTTGEKDVVEVLDSSLNPDQLSGLSFTDMKSMPVVHFDYLASAVYLDPEHPAFDKNIFVAL